MVWHFIGVYIINRTLHDRLEIRNFSSRVEKYFTSELRSLVKYFSTLEEKFRISARPCNILYLFSRVSGASKDLNLLGKRRSFILACVVCGRINLAPIEFCYNGHELKFF